MAIATLRVPHYLLRVMLGTVVLAACTSYSMRMLTQVSTPAFPLNDEEMLIAEALRRAVVDEKDIPGYEVLARMDTLVVRSEFYLDGRIRAFSAGGLPHTDKIRFVLLSRKHLTQLARLKGQLSYLFVEGVTINGDEATIHIGVASVGISSSGSTWLEGDLWSYSKGYVLLYKKQAGTWHFVEVITAWVT